MGESRKGEIYDIAQWYPRMAVYDDLRGWDTLPYLGAEFYLEYGDFDYYVTAPRDMLVAGSGELENPGEVLTTTERRRLQQARGSDRTVMIRAAEEIGDPPSGPSQQGTLTWHFRMHETRDVSFAASHAFIWDAARFNLPGGKSGLAMSFYPVESAGPQAWGRVTEYTKYSLEQFSRRWGFDYPYPVAAAIAGPIGGMEYPGVVFDDYTDKGKDLFALTAHEFGHTWFPMVVGSDERRDQWMDEGFNTFIDIYESEDFEHGVFAPKRDAEYAPGGGSPADEILPTLEDPNAPILLTRADQDRGKVSPPHHVLQVSARPGVAAGADPRAPIASTGLSASSSPIGPIGTRSLLISSAPWTARQARTFPGSGEAGTGTTGPSTSRFRTLVMFMATLNRELNSPS